MCPFCHVELGSGKIGGESKTPGRSPDSLKAPKVRHHAHVAGEYTTGKGEVRHFEAGEYICTCCNKGNLQLLNNKKNYRLPVYIHNGSHYDFTFIMKLIATMLGDLEDIPTNENKEMQIEYNGTQFKDSLKLISSPLRSFVAQTLGGTWTSTCTPKNNYAITVSHRANNGVTSISIC